ncbi:hypothetical protein [Natrarchaeobius chitinivorans]|uniref:hypothetical protein n=1 Tax=Natrarchaeobius chitinivorans TaxID=1679083 RepID=UPI0014050E6C|nr:hypothetical protein [Natrarchaeobius chitinivorans]
MSDRIATGGLVAAFGLAIVAFFAFVRGQYMLAGTCFILLSVAIYLRETRSE